VSQASNVPFLEIAKYDVMAVGAEGGRTYIGKSMKASDRLY
jgi:hypothetical protein